MAHRLHIAALLCMVGLGSRAAHADDLQQPLALKQVDIEEHLGEKLPLDLPFVDQTGKTVQLGDLFHGKPVVLSLVYFKCPMLCSLVLAGQSKVMREMDLGLGKDYEAVTVSFDPHDTPRDAEVKQHNYLQSLGKPDQKTDWTFLTGQPDSIDIVLGIWLSRCRWGWRVGVLSLCALQLCVYAALFANWYRIF